VKFPQNVHKAAGFLAVVSLLGCEDIPVGHLLLVCIVSGTCVPLLGALAKWRKAPFSFVMRVRLSALKNSAPPGRNFMKFDI
jgi:hypothetical protein